MKTLKIACIALFMTANIPNFVFAEEEKGSNKTDEKPKVEITDTTFVVPEIDLSVLNAPPRFTNEVYKRRLDSLQKDIQLDYNSYVQAYIDLYAFRKREQVERMLGLGEFYFPMVEEVFESKNIPKEFKYLAIVESALNPYAVSHAGATGMWQFMFTTGKMYGLKITSHIDERRDPYKATIAASQYFTDMYKRYGDWLLVIAAYNCGPGNVNKAIRRSGGQKNFWAIRKYLPQETRGYVPAYIAATYIMNYADKHNLYPSYPSFSFETDTVFFHSAVSFKDIESLCGIKGEELKVLNPVYKKDYIPANSNGFAIEIPATRKEVVLSMRDSLYKIFPSDLNTQAVFVLNTDPMLKHTTKIHVVKKGETLGRIASKHRVSVNDLRKWNKIKGSTIIAGQRLKIQKRIPVQQSYASNTSSAQTEKEIQGYEVVKKQSTKIHKVRSGENLSLIAAKYKVDIKDIKEWNKLRSTKLMVGQNLKIKKTEDILVAKRNENATDEHQQNEQNISEQNIAKSKTVKSNDEVSIEKVPVTLTHIVKRGESLGIIADKHNVYIKDLKEWNNIKGTTILVGQKLKISKTEEKVIVKNNEQGDSEQITSAKVPERTTTDGKIVFYKVEPGDTLWGIAKKYDGMTVEKLRDMNGLKSGQSLKAGTVLKITKS